MGSETGSNIHAILKGTPVAPANVYIADIDPGLLEEGRENYGYVPVVIDESETLPFPDRYFDIVYCSSVIEHVTVPKEQVWSTYSGRRFKIAAWEHQRQFAAEIRRTAKQYFVQTPYKHFPVESHSWLPFAAWLPRILLIPFLKISNCFWIKKARPDWHLLNKKELAHLFEDARIAVESFFGFTKSIIAIKAAGSGPTNAAAAALPQKLRSRP
ncbi:MAG: methyltransferase domain-containing protein [Gammaproteobacteria bacterium]